MTSKKVSVRIVRSDDKEFLIDGTDWAIPSDGLDGFGLFENEINTVGHGVGDGGIVTSKRIGVKDRTITAKSRSLYLGEILRRTACSFFKPGENYKVYVTYMGETRWFEGVIHKFNLPAENVYRKMTMTVTFLSPDPHLKSYDDFGKNIAEVVGMCAFPYLCNVTDGYTQGVTAGRRCFAEKVELDNDGDVEAYCKAVFRASGDVQNPKLMINDSYVRVLDDMVAGDVIIMDFAQRPPRITKNGVNCVGKCDRTSDFYGMNLVVGNSAVSFSADGGSNLLDVSIYYNKLYAVI